jgi:hypothetical protein
MCRLVLIRPRVTALRPAAEEEKRALAALFPHSRRVGKYPARSFRACVNMSRGTTRGNVSWCAPEVQSSAKHGNAEQLRAD